MKTASTVVLAFAVVLLTGQIALSQEFYCCEPCCSAPVMTTAYYAAPAAAYYSGTVGWTRYRPLFGDYVTWSRYRAYSPVVYGPGWSW